MRVAHAPPISFIMAAEHRWSIMRVKSKRTADKQSGARHEDIVRRSLGEFAQRGVLRGFEERTARGGKIEFRFTWLLDRRFTLLFDPKSARIMLKDVLPHVPAKSDLAQAVREFVAGRSGKSLPPHRRIDPAKMTAQVSVRGEKLSVAFDVKRNQYVYAVPKVLNFCNELFGYLNMYQVEYMWAHMGVPEE